MLVDTHAHLDAFSPQEVKEVVKRAFQAGVEQIVAVGCDITTSQSAVDLALAYKEVYATVGVHPHEAESFGQTTFQSLRTLVKAEKVVGVGECGLDFYRHHSSVKKQLAAFERQIELAIELDLPLIVHCRNAFKETLTLLQKARLGTFVMHCFSGSLELAHQFLKLGAFISLAGPVTFKNTRKSVEVAQKIQIEKLLVETDTPYLTPHPYRGKRNEPALLPLIARKIAETRGMSFEAVARATTENAKQVFGLD
jgi:TatD DNase family protein